MSHYPRVRRQTRRLVSVARQSGLLPEARHRLWSLEKLQRAKVKVPEGAAFTLYYEPCEEEGVPCYGSWCGLQFVHYDSHGFPVDLPEQARQDGGQRFKREFQLNPWAYDHWKNPSVYWVEWKPKPLDDLGLPPDHTVPKDLPVAADLRHLCVVRQPETESLLDWPAGAVFALWRDEEWKRQLPGAYESHWTYAYFDKKGLPHDFTVEYHEVASRHSNVVECFQRLGYLKDCLERRLSRESDLEKGLLTYVSYLRRLHGQARLVRGLLPFLPGPAV